MVSTLKVGRELYLFYEFNVKGPSLMTLMMQIERIPQASLSSGNNIAAAITEVCDGIADTE